MYERAQRIDGEVEYMADHCNDDKSDNCHHAMSQHAAQRIEYLRDNCGCKAQSQQTGVGKYISQISGTAVQVPQTQQLADALAPEYRNANDTNRTDDGQPLADACCAVKQAARCV